MKYSIALIVAAAAATVSAQLPGLPDCASGCVSNINSFGACSNSDFKCICADQSFIAGISQCVKRECSADNQRKSLQFAEDFCSKADAPIPSSVISSLTAGASASATSATSAASATATQTAAAGKFGVSGLGLGAAAALFLL